MCSRSHVRCLVAATASLLNVSQLQAVPITYAFTGSVSHVFHPEIPPDVLAPDIAGGDLLAGTFTYDPEAELSNFGFLSTLPASGSFTLGGHAFSRVGGFARGVVFSEGEPSGPAASVRLTGSLFQEQPFDHFDRAWFEFTNGASMATDAASPPMIFYGTLPPGAGFVSGRIDSITAVPEPTSILLTAPGLAIALFCYIRRRRHDESAVVG